jgi:hypothetical protein
MTAPIFRKNDEDLFPERAIVQGKAASDRGVSTACAKEVFSGNRKFLSAAAKENSLGSIDQSSLDITQVAHNMSLVK